jgi:hypothetical protein
MRAGASYTAFHIKPPFFVDYTASAKFRYQSRHSVDSQQKKEHLMKSGIEKQKALEPEFRKKSAENAASLSESLMRRRQPAHYPRFHGLASA